MVRSRSLIREENDLKTILQLVSGYLTGTLTDEEKDIAEANQKVMSEVKLMLESKPDEKKKVNYKSGKRGIHDRL